MTTQVNRSKLLQPFNTFALFAICVTALSILGLIMVFSASTIYSTKVNGNTYGTSKPEVSDDKVLIVDAQGFQSFMALKNPRIVTFLLEASETTRLNRMLYRGDQLEDAKKRIENDREQFDKQHLIKMDYVINSEAVSIEEVADKVFHYYQKHLIR
jgi:guanylate kinase